MCLTYTVTYACGYNKSVRRPSNKCNRNYKGDNIIYDDSLDYPSLYNYIVHIYSISPTGSRSNTSDSDISDHPPEDPQPKPKQPEEPRKIAPKEERA
jgi:hypothetical protein